MINAAKITAIPGEDQATTLFLAQFARRKPAAHRSLAKL